MRWNNSSIKCSQWLQFLVLSTLLVTTFGGCLFPLDWTGRWFQSGIGHLTVNSTYFESKGECVQIEGDKYIVNERVEKDPCKRCIAVYKRHDNVIQYKESNCLSYDSLEELCHDITGDQSLLSMFRADEASTIPCPFKSPPYKFSYNRGSGDCSFPSSRIDSCTDDSKLLVYFAACPDVTGTESGVEELNCLATWKEGSSRYLVAKIKKDLNLSEEDSYRCYMYSKKPGSELMYQVAQSGDATCSSVTSPSEGSKTMFLTRVESRHERCQFPSWVVSHHHWHSLGNDHSYHFSHKNATLRITREHGPTEMRLVCHHVVTNSSTVTLVAHATAGCKNGYICMVFHKRDSAVIQVQQSIEMVKEPTEACIPPFTDSRQMSSPVTLITVSLPETRCPHAGHYIASSGQASWTLPADPDPLCHTNTSVSISCFATPNAISFQTCSSEYNAVYHCHGTWSENRTTYVIASPVSRKSTDAKRYCFILNQRSGYMTLHRLSDSCNLSANRITSPLNLTLQGSCSENSASKDSSMLVLPSILSLKVALVLLNIFR
uniref:Uncharacterized protein n=1 Tax=Graphocephala atropunctata TaxID=36148 RepID=A0A1B6KQ90_9HEMI